MNSLRLTAWGSLLALGPLLLSSAAHAQDAPAPEAPAAPAAASPYDAPRAYPLQPPMAPPSGPLVRLSTDNPVARLQMMQLKWKDVCRAPCGMVVDPSALYRIGGGTVRPSPEFRMPRPTGQVAINAQVGSTVKHWVGVGMLIGGLAAAAGGGLLYAAAGDAQPDAFGGTTTRDTLRVEGIVYIVIGLVVTAIGIPLSMSSTSVQVQ